MDFEDNIRNWLMDEECLIEKKFDENADFHYIIEFPKENIMDVVKPSDSDCIVIACATQVAPEHINLMTSSDANTKKDFILDLNFALNSFLVDFELQVSQDILQQFVVTDQIFEDGLTKNEFIKTLKKVFKAKLQCIWLIDKKFGSISVMPNTTNENDMFI